MLARMYVPQSPAPYGVITVALAALNVAQLLQVGEGPSIHHSNIVVPRRLLFFHKKRAGAWVQTELGSLRTTNFQSLI